MKSETKPKKSALAKQKPSEIIQKELSKFEKRAIFDVSVNLDVSEEEAKKILYDDDRFHEVMGAIIKKKKLDMEEVLDDLTAAIGLKIERGSLEQAQKGITGWAILADKMSGQDKYSQPIKVGGKNVQINLGFPFKAYKEKNKETEAEA